MSRYGRDYFPPGSLNIRRGHSLTGGIASSRDPDENLDLFSRNHRSVSVASSEESFDGAASSLKLGRLSIGSAKAALSGLDDLLSSTDGGKHDYDWLLTPPETPLCASSDGSDSLPATAVPTRSNSLARSRSTTKASRLSVSQSESSYTSKPARSSSVTRSSISTSQFSTYSSNRLSSILNTSSASVSSYIRPSSPVAYSARPSTPSSRSSTSRPSTPSRVRMVPASSSIEKPRVTQSSRPSSPSFRPQIPANSSVPSSHSNSRPSTPTRRNSAPSLSQSVAVSSISVGQVLSNGRTSALASRPSSPGPRLRPPPQPIVPPDFSLVTPPNLRTTLPDRPLSAGRSRPVASVNAKGNIEPVGAANMPRRQPSPIVTRGRLSVPELTGRSCIPSHVADLPEHQKAPHSPEFGMKKPIKTVTSAPDTNGFGRTVPKKSLDMAMKRMDIRNGVSNLWALSNTTLFPQSIRSAASKTHSARSLNAYINGNGNLRSSKDALSENGSWTIRSPENGIVSGKGDIYESSRYDAILLKEDLNNTNWLHSVDDKSDQGSIFDNGFEHLPEPFISL